MNLWLSRLRSLVATALRWWIGELAGLVPGWLRQLVAGRRRLLLVVEDNRATLTYEGGARPAVLRRYALAAGRLTEIDRGAMGTSRSTQNGREAVVIRLPAERGLRSEMVLPVAALRNLDQVIAFEFERYTPFRREDVYFASRVIARDNASRRLTVELTSVSRTVVQEAMQLAQQIGLSVEAVEVAGVPPSIGASANLLPSHELTAKKRIGDRALAGMAVVAATLAIAAAIIPVVQMTARETALSRRVADAKRQAEASLQLQKEIDAEIRDGGLLVARKHKMPTTTELLSTMTRVLPDSSWITAFEINDSSVRITGVAASATSLLGLLDQTPIFSDASFRSPVTRDPRLDREQFDITAKIVPRAGN